MELHEEVVKYLTNTLKILNSDSSPVLLLLSGGSNLSYLDKIPSDVFNNKITISTLDERYTNDATKSNMAQIKSIDTFYKNAMLSDCNFIDTVIQSNESRDQMAIRINNEILHWLEFNSKGKVVITAGIGSDGHISGMKPLDKETFTELFEDKNLNKLITGYDASSVDSENPQRVTTNMNFFRRIKDISHIIVYAIGKDEALKKVSNPIGKLNETPARILREMPNVKYFTDIANFNIK